ncbi:hypothetical protein [Mycobacteroides abscessus]|uniref:hypothetical protein n=1 Tax=Mycobacteroides abscessus TaxID=36809 RepID=UPI000A5F96D2|nr:hypothetical protein [Mycobacteroides abscessus]
MAEVSKAQPDLSRFQGPYIAEGSKVGVQLLDGTLITGYWYQGAIHEHPRDTADIPKRPRPPAPWRIWPVNREWRIEKRLTHGYETWCRFDTSAEAYAAFAAGGAR